MYFINYVIAFIFDIWISTLPTCAFLYLRLLITYVSPYNILTQGINLCKALPVSDVSTYSIAGYF